MGYQSKTYSLSDEVVRRIDLLSAHFGSPNKAFLQVLPDSLDSVESERSVSTPLPTPKELEPLDPREIPGVSVGPPKREVAGGFPCRCIHSGCRGSKFTGTARFQNICPECSESGHKGEPRNCQSCADDSATGAL